MNIHDAVTILILFVPLFNIIRYLYKWIHNLYQEQKYECKRGRRHHYWVKDNPTYSQTCNVCEKLVLSGVDNIMRCEYCGSICHSHCIYQINYDCKVLSVKKEEFYHQWRAFNPTFGSLCSYCSQEITDLYGLNSFTCCYCQRIAHKECYEEHQKELCDMGELRSLILPPYAVHDWSSYHLSDSKNNIEDNPQDQQSLYFIMKRLYNHLRKKKKQFDSAYQNLTSSKPKEKSTDSQTSPKANTENAYKVKQFNTELSQTVKDLFNIVDTVSDENDSKSSLNGIRSALIEMSKELDLSLSKYSNRVSKTSEESDSSNQTLSSKSNGMQVRRRTAKNRRQSIQEFNRETFHNRSYTPPPKSSSLVSQSNQSPSISTTNSNELSEDPNSQQLNNNKDQEMNDSSNLFDSSSSSLSFRKRVESFSTSDIYPLSNFNEESHPETKPILLTKSFNSIPEEISAKLIEDKLEAENLPTIDSNSNPEEEISLSALSNSVEQSPSNPVQEESPQLSSKKNTFYDSLKSISSYFSSSPSSDIEDHSKDGFDSDMSPRSPHRLNSFYENSLKISNDLLSAVHKLYNEFKTPNIPQKRSTESKLPPDRRTWVIDSNEDIDPLLVFVNPKSGGLWGRLLLPIFRFYLHPIQVVNLNLGSPEKSLMNFKSCKKFRILVCGGWVLSEVEKLHFKNPPPVAILPLGTGNDLSRTLHWGTGYTGTVSVKDILRSIDHSHVTFLDRWTVSITEEQSNTTKNLPLNCYFGIGVDADVALQFHEMRNKNPNLFESQLLNKVFYTLLGSRKTIVSKPVPLESIIDLYIDGEKRSLSNIEGLVVLNIPYYAGGGIPWNNQYKQNIRDGLIEIIGFSSLVHCATMKVGLSSAYTIGQGQSVHIVVKKKNSMQIDGEPWVQLPCDILITHRNTQLMLSKAEDMFEQTSGIVFDVLRTARANKIIDDDQFNYLNTQMLKQIDSSF